MLRPQSWRRDGFLISTDPGKLEIEVVHDYLAQDSYWANGIDRELLAESMRHSLCFGVYETADETDKQIGFARVITDYSRFAYLADVFILPTWQGRGLGKWLLATILAHPDLRAVRRWALDTRDAQEFYRQFGFQVSTDPHRHMSYRPQQAQTRDVLVEERKKARDVSQAHGRSAAE